MHVNINTTVSSVYICLVTLPLINMSRRLCKLTTDLREFNKALTSRIYVALNYRIDLNDS